MDRAPSSSMHSLAGLLLRSTGCVPLRMSSLAIQMDQARASRLCATWASMSTSACMPHATLHCTGPATLRCLHASTHLCARPHMAGCRYASHPTARTGCLVPCMPFAVQQIAWTEARVGCMHAICMLPHVGPLNFPRAVAALSRLQHSMDAGKWGCLGSLATEWPRWCMQTVLCRWAHLQGFVAHFGSTTAITASNTRSVHNRKRGSPGHCRL